MKQYTEETLPASDKLWMLEKLGTVVEMVGSKARVIVTDGDKDRTIEIPTGFWTELKEAE